MPMYSWACSFASQLEVANCDFKSVWNAYISARVFPRALPCVLTFSPTGTFVCDSDRRRRSLVFGVDFFLSADLLLGMKSPVTGGSQR